MTADDAVYIGVQGTVLALDASSGSERWRTRLKGSSFVNVAPQGRFILASTRGEIFALDPATGHVIWNNKLKGLGVGFVTIGGAGEVAMMAAAQEQSDNAAGTAAAAAAAAG